MHTETAKVNYMQMLPGGHCYYCHKDYPDEHDFGKCMVENKENYHVPCDDWCKDSKFYNVEKDNPFWPRRGPGIINEPPPKTLDW